MRRSKRDSQRFTHSERQVNCAASGVASGRPAAEMLTFSDRHGCFDLGGLRCFQSEGRGVLEGSQKIAGEKRKKKRKT